MSASNVFENELLDLIFLNEAIASVGDASGLQPSATAGSLYISLHTADPGETGDQTTSEAAYTSYTRVAVARTSSGWTVADNAVENAAIIAFPEATGGSETITHVGIGTDSSGAGVLMFSVALDASRAVSSGTIPQFAAGDLTVTVD